jgi:NADPH:quinone reductase
MKRARHVIKVARFGGPEVLQLVEEEIGPPGPRQVLIRVEAAGVNFADVLMRHGSYRRNQAIPFTPGIEAAGRVVAAGDGTQLKEGEPVVTFLEGGGGYADLLIAPEERVYRLPDGLETDAGAALFIQGITAWYALHRYGRVQAGEWVLVHAAAGGVGGIAVQLAKAAGARVIATASSAPKMEIASRNGADEVVAPDPQAIANAVRTAAGGACDVVLDGVGGSLFEPSLAALGPHGRYVVVGAASQEAAPLDVRRLMPRALSVLGFLVVRVLEQDPAEPDATLRHLADLRRQGGLRLDITSVPLHDAVRAHRLVEERRHTGKLILVP